MNTYMDKTLTEKDLSSTYSENGVVFKTLSEAEALLRRKGFDKNGTVYRNKVGKQAFLYKLRDSVMEVASWNKKPKYYKPIGFLVSFGGEPKSCYDLKFTKIIRPMV